MSLWEEVRHHYEDPEEPTPPTFERSSTHTATKTHHCEACEGHIKPGEQYSKYVCLNDGDFQVHKTHADPDACAAMRKEVEAWRKAQEEAESAYMEARA